MLFSSYCFHAPRLIVKLAVLVTIGMALSTTHSDAADASPHAKLRPLPLDAVRWTDGFWADRFELCETVVIPEMQKALRHPKNGAQLVNFEIGAGLKDGRHQGTNWSDGDCYKWLEAMAWVYAVTKDEAFDREMDHWIDLIAKTQADDGYIGTQTQLNPDKERWGERVYHELYNMGHLMTAAAVHKRATGKDCFIEVAQKLGDYLYKTFKPRPKELAHFGWNPSNIMGLVDLYCVTGDPRYLELAGIFIEMRGSVSWPRCPWGLPVGATDPHPGDQNQDRVPLRKEMEAVGHAVTGPYLWCGAADVFAETGDQALLGALRRLWHSAVEQKMYITGAIGAYHHGVSSRVDMVHEAFGREYELPSRTAYNETCANISNAMWNRRMSLITGEARYADVVERVMYNSGLSGMSLDGTQFCYCNPLARHNELALLHNDTPKRWTTHSCYCCPVSVARTLAKMHHWAYSASDGALWINLYGGNVVETELPGAGRVKLVQKTDYPWDGTVRIKVAEAPAAPFAIRLRIPGWSENPLLKVNGNADDGDAKPGTYAHLQRSWKAGDVIELTFPMKPQMYEAHARVEEARNQVAVMRGPVVYCLESTDLPADVNIDDVCIPRDAVWQAKHAPELLTGVTVLETKALLVSPTGPSDALYRRLTTAKPQPVPIRLIPYFAWNNRASGDMTIWFPVR